MQGLFSLFQMKFISIILHMKKLEKISDLLVFKGYFSSPASFFQSSAHQDKAKHQSKKYYSQPNG